MTVVKVLKPHLTMWQTTDKKKSAVVSHQLMTNEAQHSPYITTALVRE